MNRKNNIENDCKNTVLISLEEYEEYLRLLENRCYARRLLEDLDSRVMF